MGLPRSVAGVQTFGRLVDGLEATIYHDFDYENDGELELKSRDNLPEQFMVQLHYASPVTAEEMRKQGRSRPHAKRLANIPSKYVVADEYEDLEDVVVVALKTMTSAELRLFQADPETGDLVFSDALKGTVGDERQLAKGYLFALGKLIYIRLIEGESTGVSFGDDILQDFLQQSQCTHPSYASDSDEEQEETDRDDLLVALTTEVCVNRIVPGFSTLSLEELRPLIRDGFDVDYESDLDGYDD